MINIEPSREYMIVHAPTGIIIQGGLYTLRGARAAVTHRLAYNNTLNVYQYDESGMVKVFSAPRSEISICSVIVSKVYEESYTA